MFGLDNKTVLVTGGNRGIGAAIVEKLKQVGAKVAYTYRSSPGPDGALAIKADVTDAQSLKGAALTATKELGPIYGLVVNAGITDDGLASRLDEDAWQNVIATNLTGAWNSVSAVIGDMYEQKEGSLVFISSIVGEKGNIGQCNYAASKAGLVGMAKSLALEGARYGVRANAIAPGFIETDMLKSIPENVKEKIIKQIPMRRFGTPDEIAWSTLFLLSPTMGGFVTGECLRVNGGHHT